MIRRAISKLIVVSLCGSGLLWPSASCLAQDGQAGNASIPVLQTGTRLVVEDVVVTDAKGDPVHGLPQSAFHVFDREKPQAIKNFDEGSPAAANAEAPPPLPPDTFSNNSFLYSPSLLSDVFLIDADVIPVTSQMFLLQQLQRSIDALPPGVQASIFCETSGHLLQVRGLTTKHDDLKSGAAACVPRLPTAVADTFVSGVQQLLSVAATLQPLPGRKSILWFSGPFPLVPLTNDRQGRGSLDADYVARTDAMHQLQNLLAAARISVFPLDPRGVIITNNGYGGLELQEEYGYMRELAEATGGMSSHLNDLAHQVDRAVVLAKDAYSLSYSPRDYQMDGSWHSVRIAVDGPYRIAYRHGYSATLAVSPPAESRRLLGSSRERAPDHATVPTVNPVVFTVQLEKAANAVPVDTSAHRDESRVHVVVRIPVAQLSFRHNGGRWQNSATVAAYAYDDLGKLKGGERQQLDSNLSEDQWQTAHSSGIFTQQSFSMPRSARYVVFVVSDRLSQREGRLLLPVQALRPSF